MLMVILVWISVTKNKMKTFFFFLIKPSLTKTNSYSVLFVIVGYRLLGF